MRSGYTTGSCASAAAAAGTAMLLTGEEINFMEVTLANGSKATFTVNIEHKDYPGVLCSVIKDAGDDPDVTNGCTVMAECSLRADSGVFIYGGEGIGIARAEGLRVPKGDWAINPAPRRMITENVLSVMRKNGYTKGVSITISVPGGEEIAKKTFNSRLGIEGGISILGTTGIVEPMSENAIIETIKVFIDKHSAVDPHNILISPGNYGQEYCRANFGINPDKSIKISNYIGKTVDYIKEKKFNRVILVGHLGKIVKIAGGIMDTHSKNADCRMEILAAHTAVAGGGRECVETVFNCKTTDEAINIIEREGFLKVVMESLISKAEEHLRYRGENSVDFALLIFSSKNELLGSSSNITDYINLLKRGING